MTFLFQKWITDLDRYEYIWQVNDDVLTRTDNWVTKSIEGLPADKLGMTGPRDHEDYVPNLITQAFVHRTHMQIFDPMYPFVFPNWYMDDWMGMVYGEERSPLLPDTFVINTPHSPRYEFDALGHQYLTIALEQGCLSISNFLHARGDSDWDQYECTSTWFSTYRYSVGLLHGIAGVPEWNYENVHKSVTLPPQWNTSMALMRTASGRDMEVVWKWIETASSMNRSYVIVALDDEAKAQLEAEETPFFYQPVTEEPVKSVPEDCQEGDLRALVMIRRTIGSGQSLLYIEDEADLHRTDFWLRDDFDITLIAESHNYGANQSVKPRTMALRHNKKSDFFLGHLADILARRKGVRLSYAINLLSFHSSFTPIVPILVLPANTE